MRNVSRGWPDCSSYRLQDGVQRNHQVIQRNRKPPEENHTESVYFFNCLLQQLQQSMIREERPNRCIQDGRSSLSVAIENEPKTDTRRLVVHIPTEAQDPFSAEVEDLQDGSILLLLFKQSSTLWMLWFLYRC
ncbi:hypothetical protein PROFUN_08090 [Planoprotostelium fungivorum]|uniref:Uncharacterized protein n=1 Tax=Planoprotostelium fungivorum TaxID=1890364 RepID=A0A2P6NKB9_9EUKA|nr:hypothetical protein PROFUN_08090 [Planoprotostelium fungivorum]